MRALVTMAPEGVEPYASGVRDLAEVARLAGWEFRSFGDEILKGDPPWQAKRLALRWAFEQGAGRVVWCDSDVVVRRPAGFAELLTDSFACGIHSLGPLVLADHLGFIEVMGGYPPGYAERLRELHARVCVEYGIASEPKGHFHDWLLLYELAPANGIAICNVWDRLAEVQRAEHLAWADGMSVAIAAKVLGLSVFFDLRQRSVRRAVTHLLHSNRNRLYARKTPS